tara:strand:- start:947 stop:2143 length:1197 start_codon:yes stop_codon:yes gene_type:complete
MSDEVNKNKKSINFKYSKKDKGQVEAVFSVFGNVDSDGDVVLPGAIKSGFKDNQVPMVFAHKWDQPIGKGTIEADDEKATFKGQFFMETEAGKEAYNLAKEMGDLQEWSFGFRIHDYEVAPYEKDGEESEEDFDVRYLKELEVFEVSPVLVGANRETYTLAIKSGEDSVYEDSDEKEEGEEVEEKYASCSHEEDGSCYKEDKKEIEISEESDTSMSGKRFSDEVKEVLAALDNLIVRAKAISALREKDGRNISVKAESALRAVQEDLTDAWNEIDDILETEPKLEEGTEEAEEVVTEEATEETPEVETEEVSEESAEEVSEEVSEEVAEEVSEEPSNEEEVAEEIIEEVPVEDESEEVEEEVEEVSDEVDTESDALFAESQALIADSYIVEVELDDTI